MSRSNSGRMAIVTGASRGIGAAIATRLASDDFSVVVNFAGRSADADALVRKTVGADGKASSARVYVADAIALA